MPALHGGREGGGKSTLAPLAHGRTRTRTHDTLTISPAPCPPYPAGFHLKPFCFFDMNPGVDLPAGSNSNSQLAGGCCAKLSNGVH